jgi:osmoprotectant transport system permease protein
MRWALRTVLLMAAMAAMAAEGAEPVRVASKNFNESYVLGEIVAQLLEADGFDVERKFGLGGTLICFDALTTGAIDVYVEYTGTLSQAILNVPEVRDLAALNALVADRGIELTEPFGFNNTYAIATRRAVAEADSLVTIGDLAAHPDLKVVVSHEFLEREDGWPGLAARYGLTSKVGGIEHGLAYQAIAEDSIDVTDAYSTDGELRRYDLVVLQDDRDYFPQYLAAPLIRSDLPERVREVLARLGNSIDDTAMQDMNAAVVFEGRTFADVANAFLSGRGLVERRTVDNALWSSLGSNTLRHLELTAAALLAAVIVGVGLSLAVFQMPVVSKAVTYFCGLLQTIPSIALLALMIPLFGIGVVPAIVALFLYSLLPILRNSLTALTTLDPTLIRVAVGMGLSERERLRYVYVPLSLPAMFAGIRTAAVISIGTATLAAFIGAGGLGDPIVTGLALNDVGLILQGAVPAAALAVVTELSFEALERWVLPAHMGGRGERASRG